VHILRMEETGKTGTFVPGLHFPMEQLGSETDSPSLTMNASDPQESSGVHIDTPWFGSIPGAVHGLKARTCADFFTSVYYGGGYALVSNGTAVVEVGNASVRGRAVAHLALAQWIWASAPTCIVIYDTSELSSTGQESSIVTPHISSREGPSEPLADYNAYAVGDWDGYDALPITNETLHAARSILKSLPKTFGDPVCSPGADGSIAFEWLMDEGPLRKLFIDIGPGRTWKAYWRLANGNIGTIPRKSITLSTIPELQKLFETLLRG
jgi:hypothetical protein